MCRQPLFTLVLLAILTMPMAVSGMEKSTGSAIFTEVTDEVGLTGIIGYRLNIADLNGDGYPDIFAHHPLTHGTGDVLNKDFLYLNLPGAEPGTRQFVDYTEESGIRANRQGTTDGRHNDSGIFADVDNDGDLDIFTLVYLHDNYSMDFGTNDLLLNDGSAHFTLAPNSPFHTEPNWNTAGAVFLDYDNDGNIDLFIGTWYMNNNLAKDHLYRGHGDGTFTRVSVEAGFDDTFTAIYGVAACDWDGDGDTDIFAPSYSHTRPSARSRHFRNNGDGTFTEVQEETNYTEYTGYQSTRASFGCMPADFDNDGDIDLFEILTHGRGDGASGAHSTVLVNEDGVFTWDFAAVDGRADEDPLISHHGDHYASWFDWDNDGLYDFVLTESSYDNNRIYLFKQEADHTFHPVTVDSGINQINIDDLPVHNAMGFDYDLDGDEDLLVGIGNGTDEMRLFRNDIGLQNNWLNITLEGRGGPGFSNRAAIGARVSVTAGDTTWTREVYAGNGHHGPQVPLCLNFGLGQAATVDRIEVRWPNASLSRTVLTDVPVNSFITVSEWEEEPTIVTGPGPAAANPPQVRVFRAGQSEPFFSFAAYGASQYGVNVTTGQLDGTGYPEIVTGAGPGAIYGPHVRGWSIAGATEPRVNFLAYGTNKFGVNVALGDLDDDGYDEIVTGAGPGAVFGPHVRGWNWDGAGSVDPIPGISYFAYGTPKWGVNVCCGDIDGDGYDEIVTGAGPGAVYGPHVRGWNVDGGGAASMPGVSFLAYGTNKFGVNVACGDIDGDGIDELVTGAGPGAVFGPHVRGWNYDGATVAAIPAISFFAWDAAMVRYGANVSAAADLDGDGRNELVVGAGPDPDVGGSVKTYRYDGSQVSLWQDFDAYPGLTHGATVASAAN